MVVYMSLSFPFFRPFNAVARQKLALRQTQKENVFHIHAFTFGVQSLLQEPKKINKSKILTEASASVYLLLATALPLFHEEPNGLTYLAIFVANFKGFLWVFFIKQSFHSRLLDMG